ncbi:hypothetical protein TWF730_007470 [Orbilia blumenaviensis]|uniref:Uncharacterized protein n=1 Tax=Orbilia blumenaviensis TaxID=1796055 RepID=A0AAV9V7U4_9PEZI
MCRKLTYHKPCGHITAKFQHRPCANGKYCPRVSQELNSERRCAGCREDAERVTEHPFKPPRDGSGLKRSESNSKSVFSLASTCADEEEQQRRESELYRRTAVDHIFNEAITTARYTDHRAQELRESRERRAERAQRRGFDMPVHESDSFKWVPKKWWRNFWKWRTRPAMYLDGENGHHKLCGCCHTRREPHDNFSLAFAPRR